MSIAEWPKLPSVSRFNSSDETARADAYMCQSDALRERLRDTAAALAANVSTEVQSDCRWDQHGNCQAHYVESPCRVAEGRAILKRLKEEGLI